MSNKSEIQKAFANFKEILENKSKVNLEKL